VGTRLYQIYLFYCNLEVQLSDRLAGRVGEESCDMDSPGCDPAGEKANVQLRVQYLHVVLPGKSIALRKGGCKVPIVILDSGSLSSRLLRRSSSTSR